MEQAVVENDLIILYGSLQRGEPPYIDCCEVTAS